MVVVVRFRLGQRIALRRNVHFPGRGISGVLEPLRRSGPLADAILGGVAGSPMGSGMRSPSTAPADDWILQPVD